MARLQSRALAKVNLTLRIVRRRADGYHDIVSVVAFADMGDTLTLIPGDRLDLEVRGPNAAAISDASDNLVLLAARALAERISGVRLGRFDLTKHMPVGAGLGGGSANAAAAFRLLTDANNLSIDDPRILSAAGIVGADVAVCLSEKARVVSGVGDRLSAPLRLPPLPAVIVFPSVPVMTGNAFRIYDELGIESLSGNFADHPEADKIPLERDKFIAFLNSQGNDLTRATHSITPAVTAVEECLHKTSGARLVRMTGSGSSVFALYDSNEQAKASADEIRMEHTDWWVRATTLG